MRKLKLFLTVVAASLMFGSCGFDGPDLADEPQIKAWVLMENISYTDKIAKRFVSSLLKEGSVELFDPNHPTAQVVIQDSVNPYCGLFSKRGSEIVNSWRLNRHETIKVITDESLVYRAGWGVMDEECVDYFRTHEAESKQLLREVAVKWVDYVYDYANEEVKVLDWEYCFSTTTDSFSGYYVTYEIGEGYYVLVRLTEADNGDEFEVKRIYRGDSLLQLERAYMDAEM